jgi:hypothetical protein
MDFVSEEQRQAVLDDSTYKHINGCAGSRKTDTLVKCAIREMEQHNSSVLFLTKVSSVTEEIKARLERDMNVKINKQGQSNHYIGNAGKRGKGPYVSIANYDAWVHHSLLDKSAVPGDEFSRKKQQLLKDIQQAESFECVLKNGKEYHVVCIDEVNDFQPSDMRPIIALARKCSDLKIFIAGDYVQSIFGGDDKDDDTAEPAMNMFKLLKPAFFTLSKCFRCPKPHVDFNNLLMRKILPKYGLPEMIPNNENTEDRPILFPHRPMSKHIDVACNVDMACKMIECLLENDTTIHPRDIVFIMGSTNESNFYNQLKHQLSDLYRRLGYEGETVHHFQTAGDGYNKSIKWSEAENKTVLMSIHADKGKDHRVVFFMGFTERSIPRENQVFKSSELQAESLMNVATSRSTKYLFVGFTTQAPSRYLQNVRLDLAPFVYRSWEPDDATPEIYQKLIDTINSVYFTATPWPKDETQYQAEELMGSVRPQLEVKAHISKDFERVSDIIHHDWSKYKTVDFGTKYEVETPFHEDHYPILGEMCELLVIRQKNKEHFRSVFSPLVNGHFVGTSNTKLLSLAFDYGLNRGFDESAVKTCMENHASWFSKHPEYKDEFKALVANKCIIINELFNTKEFARSVNEFMSNKPSRDIRTSRLWNLTLLYRELTGSSFMPGIRAFLNYFDEDITTIHENIAKYSQMISSSCLFQKRLGVKGIITEKNKLETLNINLKRYNEHVVRISGIADIFDTGSDILHEIKASKLDHPSKEWIIQTALYCALLPINPDVTSYMDEYETLQKSVTWYTAEGFSVVNILQGKMYLWTDLPDLDIEDILEDCLQEKYGFHEYEMDILQDRIAKMKSWREGVPLEESYEVVY